MTPDLATVTMAQLLDKDGGFFCFQRSSEAVRIREVTLTLNSLRISDISPINLVDSQQHSLPLSSNW